MGLKKLPRYGSNESSNNRYKAMKILDFKPNKGYIEAASPKGPASKPQTQSKTLKLNALMAS